MEPDCSLPCSQKPATGLYLDPFSYIPHYPGLIWIQIFFSQQRQGLPGGLLPSDLPTRTIYAFLSAHVRAACPTILALLDMIISP
jgi:hypothetical protein